MASQRLLPENWLKIILKSNVDDLISLYKSHSSFRNILNDKYTLKLLLDNYKIKTRKEVISFNDFINEYDHNYASDRCEFKYNNLNQCIHNASARGQLYWVLYYLDKDPNNTYLAELTLLGAIENDNVNLGKWLMSEYPSLFDN